LIGRLEQWLLARRRHAVTIKPLIQPTINPIFFMLALPLLVPGVGADHTDDAFAANNLAILAKLLH
jgi:hypothetical protein